MKTREKILIPDTSVLIFLSKINKLSLLKKMYKKVIVPPAVKKEYKESLPEWIKIIKVKNSQLLKILSKELSRGESEVISLALEYPDSIIALDDKKAREIARDLNLKITGTLGILLKAKNLRLIKNISFLLKKLESQKFYISDELKKEILRRSKEL